MTWKLQAISDELAGADLIIDRDMLVGRHQDADVLLQSAAISRRHAAFLLKEQQLYLQDLNSSNGTFVNAVRIQTETQLHANDKIQFANIEFVVLQQPHESIQNAETTANTESTANTEAALQSTAVQNSAEEQLTLNEQKVLAEQKTPENQQNSEEQKPVDQGMPSLAERAADITLGRDGMPQQVAIPKPAPIPEGVDLTAVQQKAEPEKVAIETPPSAVEQQLEQKKNVSVGLLTVIVLVIIAVLAWWFLQ
ncbi:FHA domain-containing protein [Acinetobacter larvae]|uniref:FHA domain-containing protein n=1 Tax=Acinetobacter larvae TaxID=1789224 RepID=A0A1B2M2W6_9GAMM|nr:FHA domain-containing protein [Acinetobacter larvae]AOA59540.1 hypothetical protein BFG52_15100 [Acinetobacter larvae]